MMKVKAFRWGGLRLARSLVAIVILLSSLVGSLALPQRVTADDGQASVSLEGPTEPVSVGDDFQVRVKLGNVADLYGAEFHLSFDPNLMEVVRIEPGPLLQGAWPQDPPMGWPSDWPWPPTSDFPWPENPPDCWPEDWFWPPYYPDNPPSGWPSNWLWPPVDHGGVWWPENPPTGWPSDWPWPPTPDFSWPQDPPVGCNWPSDWPWPPGTPPSGWPSGWTWPPSPGLHYWIADWDNSAGELGFAETLVNPSVPVSISEPQILATVTFHCKAAGVAQVSFSNPLAGEPAVKLADFEDKPISYGELRPITITQITQGLPDLVVKEKSESWVNEAQKTYQVSYTIKNQGNATAPAGFDIALIVNGRKVEEQEIVSALAPSEEHSGTFSEVFTLQGDHDKVIVVVDCNREVEESDEINNVLLNFFPPLRSDLIQAIENGKAWLADQQNADGSWGDHWQVAKTALAVLKFEIEAFEQGLSPFDSSYTYSAQVKNGFDYIFANAHIEDGLSPQSHDGTLDNPDLDGDNLGVFFISPVEGFPIYETSIVAMAIAASNAPGRVINVPGSPVDGWTFEEVLRDVVDYLAWAQTDKGFGRGGWNYEPMDNYGPRSDESNTGWVTLGLAWAEAPPPLGFGLAVPGFVKRELGLWLRYIQNSIPGSPDEGGAGYTAPFEWVNILKTGNLLQQLAWLGATPTDPRVQKAVNYLFNHWNDPNDDPGWKGFPGQPASYHATYTVMRGLDSLHIPFIGPATSPIDWFGDMAGVIISQQNSDGSWPSCIWDDHDQILATEWALLTLERVVTPPREGPDLVIESKSEDWTVDQSAYVVGFTVKNQGNAVAKAPFQVSIYVDGNLSQEITVDTDLGPGETASFTSSQISWSSPSDEVMVCADRSADPTKDNVVDELNEANNCLINVFPPPPGKPDLVVLQKGEEPAGEPGQFKAYFVLQNKGTATAPAGHDAGLYVDGAQVEQKEIPVDIPPGGIYADAFNTLISLPKDALWAEVEVCADVNDGVDELDEDNNCLTNRLLNEKLIKWAQMPTPCPPESDYPECFCGWDQFSWYDSADKPIVADDWPCKDDRPITDIHWWGSYEGYADNVPPSGAPQAFHIGIWSDEVDAQGKHHPGELIAEWTVDRSELNEHAVGCDLPFFLNQPETTFEYDFIIPEDKWFYQDPGQNQVYWLSISAVYPQGANPQHSWGWLTREHMFGSPAIGITDPQAPSAGSQYAAGQTLQGENQEPVDMSFVLTTAPCAPALEVEKKVFNPETQEWVDEITAQLNDEVAFRCTIHNSGTCCDLAYIKVVDILPDGLRYADEAEVNGTPQEPKALVPDQENEVTTGTSIGCGHPPMGLGSLFQSFVPSASPLAAVKIRLRAGGSFPAEGYTTTIKLREGSVDGMVLGTADAFVPGPQATGSIIDVPFVFSPPLEVIPGQTYVIEWVTPPEGDVILTWMVGEGNPYPGGTAFGCEGTPVSDEDFIFTTYTFPEPQPDQENEVATGESIGCGAEVEGSLYQSFVPSASSLAAVKLRLRVGGSFPAEGYTTTIKLREGSPTGTVLRTADAFVPGPQAPDSIIDVLFVFSPPEPVTPGDTYVIEWLTPGDVILTWMVAKSDTYSNGHRFSCDGSAVEDEDFIFTTYAITAEEGKVLVWDIPGPLAPCESVNIKFKTKVTECGQNTNEVKVEAAGCGQIVIGTGKATVNVPCAEKYHLTVNVEPEGAGTVELDPTQPADGYDAGTVVTLTATPAQGYVFDHWSANVTVPDSTQPNVGQVTMDADKTVTAYFAPVAAGWSVTLNITSDIGSADVVFGTRPNATAGFDPDLDDPAAPAPPEGISAYFWYPENTPDAAKKLRASYIPPADTMIWPLKVKYIKEGPAEGDVTISWNAEEVADIPSEYSVFLRDKDDITTLADMRSTTSYTFRASVPEDKSSATYTFLIKVSRAVSFTLNLKAGWNLISLPVNPGTTDPAEILSDVGYFSIYAWDPVGRRYVKPAEMTPGKGYWVLVLNDASQTITGMPVTQFSFDCSSPGWYLIGSLYSTAEFTATPSENAYSRVYAWDAAGKRYSMPQVNILPGTGNWFLALGPCSVRVNLVMLQ